MQSYWQVDNGDTIQTIYQGDALEVLRGLPSESVHCCITSPPYWGLRDYGVEGQIGLKQTLQEYVEALVEVFREVRRVLRLDGTLWLNLGDSYAGSWGSASGLKPKDLVGVPWRVAFALQADGWYLRSDIIWHKPNSMPESVTDRPTKAHEYIFLLAKSRRYYYDAEAIKEPLARPEELLRKTPAVFGGRNKHDGYRTRKHSGNEYVGTYTGRNKRSVWTVPTKPFPEAHFAVYPPALITPCILAGCPVGGTVLDPFAGSGTTLLVATQHHRKSIGIELNPEYIEIAKRRLNSVQLKLVME